MDYLITLTLSGKDYLGKGATMVEALTNLTKPDKLMGKAILKLKHGERKQEHLLQPARLKRFFYTSQSSKQIQAKQLELSLK